MSLARLSVRNPVLANLVMIAIIVLGIVSLAGLPRELLPDISMHWVYIATPYPGVPPEEIEKLITIPIEEEIKDVEDIDSISSQSNDGASVISVKFKQMSDDKFRLRLQDLRAEVDKVKDLPEDAWDTEIMSLDTSIMMPVITAHLYGNVEEKYLTKIAKELRDLLLDIPRISKVELTGTRDREVWVEVDPVEMEGQRLSIGEIQAAIAARGLNIPGGSISVGRQELFVRTVGEFKKALDIERVIVRSTPIGGTVRVQDVADIRDGFEDEITRSRLNLEPVVSLTITKQKNGNSIDITDQVKRISREFSERAGDRVKVAFTQDTSEQINDIMSKLIRNAWMGFIIVLAVLLLVLGLRNAILAALGIPLSFLACFIFMFNMGETFNGNSLFGLVLVLGIIVDDAIIIVENCYRHRQMGKSWHEAAIQGTEEVTAPVFAAIATTIAVFLPLMLMPGIMGKFMRIVPVVVSLALFASLIEALFILPAHFAEWPGRSSKKKDRPTPVWLLTILDAYAKGLKFVIKTRYIFVLIVLPAFLLGASMLIPLVGVNMYSGEEINTFQVRVNMPTGTNLDTTSEVLKEFEKAALQLPKSEVRSIHTTAGIIITDAEWIFRSDVGQAWFDLVPSYERTRSSDLIMDDLRQRIQEISGPINIELAKLNTGPPLGKPVEVKVKGKYFDPLQAVAEELKTVLSSMEGVMDVGDDFRAGRREVKFRIDPERAALHGLSVALVGQAIRNAIDGVVAEKLYDGDEEIDIVVRMNMKSLERPEDLLRLPLLTPTGSTIALGNVAEYRIEHTRGEIKRYKGQRAITVFSDIDKSKTDQMKINQKLKEKFKDIQARYPGVNLDFSGELQEFKEAFTHLVQLFLFGLLLIYAILGTQFRSYAQPLVILFTIPFAFIGAVFGLLISGNPFSIITMYGIVALAGIAVNDAIVLISFINNAKAGGMSGYDAVIEAGKLRLRPILLTSLTTIAGLLPMALEIGGASLTWSPLANTIIWGLTLGTLLTLFMIPALYVIIIEDIGGLFRRA
ncbi:MAG: efflux RND transporter permease subunit [Deltaproteobacteria bacterium]|nr:efflux RND transporter permease subunit [Deltaproteobacteria bacterium]